LIVVVAAVLPGVVPEIGSLYPAQTPYLRELAVPPSGVTVKVTV